MCFNGQAFQRFNQPCKDIPNGFAAFLPEDYVQWGEKCDTWGVRDVGRGCLDLEDIIDMVLSITFGKKKLKEINVMKKKMWQL